MRKFHRIFIAIGLSEDIKDALANYQQRLPDLPARWTKPDNLHITLVFIGDASDQGISEIKQVLKNIVVRHKPFIVSLNSISYNLPETIPPRMIWAFGNLSKEFVNLQKDLEKELSRKIKFVPEKRESILHITLARIKEWEWRRIEPDERPGVGESIDFSFEVESVKLMESVLKRSGPEYKILESYFLNS